ncbi:hypothetical protein QBC38DRAFT_500652 [Podospora fimiseda]|uniref:Transfer RNA methyltransferase 82 n=1 Tax=Podospora fimiseda TaxID=252190 RepID=A0AAN7GW90_9PEZI|nr:hypothetical protein QBC38DRAFT_500652 [Podospora fimiseda]
MAVPYHLLKACGGIVFASQGTDIHSFGSNLEHISTWKYPLQVKSTETTAEKPAATTEPTAEVSASPTPEGPPAKRRRTEETKEETPKDQDATEEAAAAAPVKKGRFHRSPVQVANERPFINCLIATTDGRHLILTTGSDKTIWVLEHDGAGNLKQLSQRPMPKRPCSITLTHDNTTILSADKFGDVYALPLIPSSEPTSSASTPKPIPSRSATPSSSTTPGFKPQANEFTVHTRRNLRALENQRLTAEQVKQQKEANEAEKAQFEHTLLLGHVSMLTAITVGQAVSPATGIQRDWIITADRDEHIRVSRGVPQAHVIDNFCLGHEDFVKSLCILPGHPSILVSGGGDDDILLWDWLGGKLITRAPVLQHVKEITPEAEKVAVGRVFGYQTVEGETKVAVVVERVPALFIYTFSPETPLLQHTETISLPGNLLDVEYLQKQSKLLVTVDHSSSLIIIEGSTQTPAQNLPAGEDLKIEPQELQKLLYTTESLRKLSDFD